MEAGFGLMKVPFQTGFPILFRTDGQEWH